MNILRIIFAIFWLVAGLNGIFHLLPLPSLVTHATHFHSLEESGDALAIIYIIEAIAGAFLLLDRFGSLAVILLLPITSDVVFYDLFHYQYGLLVSAPVFAIHIILLYGYRNAYSKLFKATIK